MEIWVEFDGEKRKFNISPEPAVAKRGTPVMWRFQANNLSTVPQIRWVIHFGSSSPFGALNTLTTKSSESAGQHTAATGPTPTDVVGDHKYAVRAVDPSTEDKLGDDDPYLRVVP